MCLHALSLLYSKLVSKNKQMQHRIKLNTMPAFAEIQYTTYILVSKDYLYISAHSYCHCLHFFFSLYFLYSAGSRLLEIVAGDFSQFLREMPGCGL